MALTRAQIMEHVGEMMDHGFENDVTQNDDLLNFLMRWGKLYRNDSTFGTQADRSEAMITIKEKLFTKLTGLDPVANAHTMDAHWIVEAEKDREV